MSYYDYQDLRQAAFSSRSQSDIDALGRWMELYGMDSWNGIVFDIDDGYSLRPVMIPVSSDEFGDSDTWEVSHYEIV